MTHPIHEFLFPAPHAAPEADPLRLAAGTAPASVAKPCGRPSLYTAEIAKRLLDELAAGRPLDAVCHDDDMPPRSTVRQWVSDDREGFAARYREAKKRAKTDVRPGRPPVYTTESAERILEQLSAGRTLADICGDPGMPVPGTVWQWMMADRDGFAERYRRAREIGRARLGRHTLYTAERADWIVDQLTDGRTLADVCRDPGMPARATVQLWVEQNREEFAERYKTARDKGFHAMAEQIIDIADDARRDWVVLHKPDGTTETVVNPQHLPRCKLRIHARSWLLSKLLPKHYGDRPDPPPAYVPGSEIAALMKEINGKSRGLPSQRSLDKPDGSG
jgi:hypothetical protein